jgi:hypothetical protein
MSRNLNCNCLCHGSDGNHNADSYFSCKNCYAANHMGNLPRQPHEQPHKAKAPGGGKKGPRKPRVVTEAKLDKAVKVVAASIMNDLAAAAESLKFEQKTPGTASLKVPVLEKK